MAKKQTPLADRRPAEAPVNAVALAPVLKARPSERGFLARMSLRVSKMLGSLQVAVVLMTALVAVLIAGTVAESHFSAALAGELIYRSWWFNLLMAGLFLNIFFAAAKKYPWKRHQTGFVITHIGLLLMIIGGVFNSLYGVDSLMRLATDDGPRAKALGVRQTTDEIFDIDEGLIEVAWLDRGEGASAPVWRTFSDVFDHGSLTWRSDPEDHFRLELPPGLHLLSWLARPWRHSFELAGNVDGQRAELEVLNYYTHARTGLFRARDPGRDEGSPAGKAVRVELTNPLAPPDAQDPFWLSTGFPAGSPSRSLLKGFEVRLVERVLSPAEAEEFTRPPARGAAGPGGQLVVIIDGRPHRFEVPLDPKAERLLPVGDTGWGLRILAFRPSREGGDLPEDPLVLFVLNPPGGDARGVPVQMRASVPGQYSRMGVRGGDVVETGEGLPEGVGVWYHPPAQHLYREGLAAELQFSFVRPAGGGEPYLAYRSFAEDFSALQWRYELESSGRVPAGEPLPVWRQELPSVGRSSWELRVTDALADAVPSYRPENKRPGLEDPARYRAVAKCRMSYGGESREFWLPLTNYVRPGSGSDRPDDEAVGAEAFPGNKREVTVGGKTFRVGFHRHTEAVPFKVKLLRGETTTDPGGGAATYSSYVRVMDSGEGGESFDHQITMNEPLNRDGYKLFQTGMDHGTLPPDPETGRPNAISTFTVSYDPGLWLKYVGSAFLALGIFTMFYMKAYTFKPRGRRPAAAGEGK